MWHRLEENEERHRLEEEMRKKERKEEIDNILQKKRKGNYGEQRSIGDLEELLKQKRKNKHLA